MSRQNDNVLFSQSRNVRLKSYIFVSLKGGKNGRKGHFENEHKGD
jgi:hypothetical protein